MKHIQVCLLLLFNLTLSAYSSETLNNFFSYNLSFVQTSFNNINNVFDKSYGNFYRNSDNSIKIEINEPFKETYIIDRTGIEIHDLDFNQKRFIKKDDISNNLIDFINNGFPKNPSNIEIINKRSFKIFEGKKIYYFEFLDKNILQIKYKDNMNIDTLINFSKSDVN